MQIIKNKIQIDELKRMAEKRSIGYQTEKFKKRWQKLSFFEQMAHIGKRSSENNKLAREKSKI